jgi:hypothetical protein
MKQKHPNWLKNSLVRISKLHFLLALAYVVQIVAYDAAKLITPDVVLNRWYAIAALTGIAVAVWYLARTQATSTNNYKGLAWLLILSDIAFAAFNVYTQRGMASRAVLLFVIPIVVSAALLSRVSLFATAILAVAAYTTVAVAYFVHFFNEGYKIELYGEIFFYSALLLIIAGLLWAVVRAKKHL